MSAGDDIWARADARIKAQLTELFALVIEGKCSAEDAESLLPKLLNALRAQLALSPGMEGIECRLHLREAAQFVIQVGR